MSENQSGIVLKMCNVIRFSYSELLKPAIAASNYSTEMESKVLLNGDLF